MSVRRVVPATPASRSRSPSLAFSLGSWSGAAPDAAADSPTTTLADGAARRRGAQHPRDASSAVARPSGTDGAAAAGRRRGRRRRRRARWSTRSSGSCRARWGCCRCTCCASGSESFVELNAYDDRGKSSYGTAGYLGNGYFITVKHGVIALDEPARASTTAQDLVGQGQLQGPGRCRRGSSTAGDAKVEVDPGDWAIIKVQGDGRPAGAERRPGLRLRLRRADLPAGQRLLEGHHPLHRLRRPAHRQQPGDLPDRRPSRRVGRRRAQPATASWSAFRSAGCRATTASRSSCRCAQRCSGRCPA